MYYIFLRLITTLLFVRIVNNQILAVLYSLLHACADIFQQWFGVSLPRAAHITVKNTYLYEKLTDNLGKAKHCQAGIEQMFANMYDVAKFLKTFNHC